MKLLLPYSYKKTGKLLAPLGFIVWLLLQRGYVTQVLIASFGEPAPVAGHPPYSTANIFVAVLSFFSFLGGMYLVAFSKEKIEDEMVQQKSWKAFNSLPLFRLFV